MYGQGNSGRFRPRNFAPVKVGEEIDVKIEAVGEKGDGIAKKKGFVLFVPGVSQGDEVRIRITKVLRNVGFAEVIGKAQGPIEQDERAAPQKKPADDDQQQGGEQQEEASYEDSEDFGEGPSEE